MYLLYQHILFFVLVLFLAKSNTQLKTNCKILYEHNLSYYRNTIITKEFPCICMDLLGPSVYQLLLDKKLEGMPLKTIQNIMKSVLITLDDISSIGVIHMDIRPENILQSANDPNKFIVVDYHCAGLEGRTNPVYVQSRFYRAPEVLLRLEYGCKIDIWSLGVAAFEMMVGVPLFPGNTEVQMLYIINSMVGPFPQHMIEKSSRRLSFFLHDGTMKSAERLAEENMENIEDWKNCLIYKTIAENILTYRYPDLNELPPQVREQRLMFIDLLMKCVTIDPEKRISAAEALRHSFITSNLDNSD